MKKKRWNRALAVLLMMVMSISLLSACGGKSEKKEDAETITVYLLKCYTNVVTVVANKI